MSEIDWSKAPGDAHGYMPQTSTWIEGWWKRDTNCYFWSLAEGSEGGWRKTLASPFDNRHFVPRPSTDWSGEGLPPVGVVCEVNDARINNWRAVDGVIAHVSLSDRDVAVFRIGDYIAYSPADRFRPIRTPEQIASDERESAVNGMLCYDALGGSRRGLAEALYDAGYRKVEQPK